jgi:hypothetical protein
MNVDFPGMPEFLLGFLLFIEILLTEVILTASSITLTLVLSEISSCSLGLKNRAELEVFASGSSSYF